MTNTLSIREPLPFGERLGLGQGLLTREEGGGGGEAGEGAGGGSGCWEGEEGVEECLQGGEGVRGEVGFGVEPAGVG